MSTARPRSPSSSPPAPVGLINPGGGVGTGAGSTTAGVSIVGAPAVGRTFVASADTGMGTGDGVGTRRPARAIP